MYIQIYAYVYTYTHTYRSRLDSLQAWVPAENKAGEWMVIDLGRVMTVCGIVTQARRKKIEKKKRKKGV